jgi:hypothetical protein
MELGMSYDNTFDPDTCRMMEIRFVRKDSD